MKTEASDMPVPADRPEIPVREEVRTPPGPDGLDRRTALKLFSVTALLAATGCGARKPERRIVSLAETPEYLDPGIPLHYASTFTDGPVPYGMKVKARDGRPVKIEGLPGHPLNDGTSSAQMQSAILSLYDPERLRSPLRGTEETSWKDADAAIVGALKQASSAVLVTRSLLGPSERRLVELFLGAVRGAKHFVWETAHDGPRRKAWREIYGRDGVLVPDLAKAKVVLSIGSDFLGTDGDVLAASRGFAERRKVDGDATAGNLSRIWVVEPTTTVTGSNADQRIPLRPSAAAAFVDAVRRAHDGDAAALDAFAKAYSLEVGVLTALVDDLRSHHGEAVVLGGPQLPAAVHAAVALLNESLGAHGTTLAWNADPATLPVNTAEEIGRALEAGPDVAVLLGVNPGYDWPGGGFETLLGRAKLSVGHGLQLDETLALCGFALPSAHNLESWNDATPVAGVRAVCQPLIAPLFDGRQEAESLFAWTLALAPNAFEGVANWHDFVQRQAGGAGRAWDDLLRKGWKGEPALAAVPGVQKARAEGLLQKPGRPLADLDLLILPSNAVLDGRFTSSAWLLEMADPVSRLVWDNAVSIGPETAKTLGLMEKDVVRVTVGGTSVTAPVLVQTGTSAGVAALTLGFGRTKGAGQGTGVGYSAAPLLGTDATPHWKPGAKLEKTGGTHKLVRMQRTFSQEGREIAREATVDEYRHHPEFAKHRVHVPELVQLHEEWDYSKGHKWAMAIDMNACTGCSACTIACRAENNIPIVGKEECSSGRDMSWIRIDRYESDDAANPDVQQMPMLCQHCDNAPCENVCPVNATAHSPEGLNEQVYNRCVGTRYCANNCPYKVRRFNYLNYHKDVEGEPTRELMFNPNVTVRMRGVMEKCTFCVQRINAAKYEASNAGVPLADGAVAPACQQACPANAIVFGDGNTEGSEIAKKRSSPLGYHVLEEINVRPNVTYLAKVRNPHPSLAGTAGTGAHEAEGHGDEHGTGGHR